MSDIQIKGAIDHFNSNLKEGDDKLNQKKLATMIMPELDIKTAKFYISRWSNGQSYGKLMPCHVISICEITGVKPDFLYGYE